MGNLYFDKRWWSVAMDHYRAAIKNNAGYKRNAILNRNVIRMLVSKKTDRQSEAFLRRTIGKASLSYLQQAARVEKNSYLRSRSAALARAVRSQ
jgi:hypothetical protein